jgi:hypothetical protein
MSLWNNFVWQNFPILGIPNAEEVVFCDVELHPRLGRHYAHFDIEFFLNSENIATTRSEKNSYSEATFGCFKLDEVKKYILSEDKKKYRERDYYNLQETIKIPSDWISPRMFRDRYGNNSERFYLKPKTIKCFPFYICPTCAHVFPSDPFKDCASDSYFKFRRCKYCIDEGYGLHGKNRTAFYSYGAMPWVRKKDPRAFLYERYKKPSPCFYQKYIQRRLNKIKRFRPVSCSEVNYFRSWLGLKELGALAN